MNQYLLTALNIEHKGLKTRKLEKKYIVAKKRLHREKPDHKQFKTQNPFYQFLLDRDKAGFWDIQRRISTTYRLVCRP